MSDKVNPSKDFNLEKNINLKNDFNSVSYDEWRKKVEIDLKGVPFDKKLITKTIEEINLQPIYTRKNLDNLNFLNEIPGSGNNIRGANHSGYLKNGWEIAQEIPYGLAEDFNQALVNDLSRGQNSIVINLDTATLHGLDADYSQPDNVGDSGTSISGLQSFSRALMNINIQDFPININCGYTNLPMISILGAYLQNENLKFANIKGSVYADPLDFVVKYGSIPQSYKSLIDDMSIGVKLMNDQNSSLKSIGVSGLHYVNSGASAVQELAFMASTAVQYITDLLSTGLTINEIVERVRFSTGIGSNFFMEIAKLRALKLIWSKITLEFGADEVKSKIWINASTSKSNKTVYDPYVNMLRTTTEAFSAIMGSIDSVTTNNFDELFGEPTDFSRRISRNTQLILKEETHLNNLIDPAGGSFFIEDLTNQVAEKSWSLFQELEKNGGMIKSLEKGIPQNWISETSEKRILNYSKRKSILVGTNMYSNPNEKKLKNRESNVEMIFNKRSKYLKDFRVSNEHKNHNSILSKLQEIVDTKSVNSVYTAIDAISEGATLGEISKSLCPQSDAFSINKINEVRFSELFDNLRDASIKYSEQNGHKPKVFLANIGTVKQFKGRADFSRGFFEIAGFEIIYPNGSSSIDEAVDLFKKSNSEIAVLCSTDDTYPELVPEFTKKFKIDNPKVKLVLAGYPKNQVDEYKNSGIDYFIYLGADTHKILSGLMKNIGAL